MIKFLAYIICYCLYPLSFLFPRRKDWLIFGSFRGAFNENSKYLYLYAREVGDRGLDSKNAIRAIWISTNKKTVLRMREKRLEAYFVGSARGIWYALRGQYWFVNAYTSDILFCLAGGATVVNLWHGLPWKCIEFGIKKGELAKRYSGEDKWDCFYHPACFRRPDYVASAGMLVTDIFADAFRINPSQCLPCGYPRDMLLFRKRDEVLDFIRRYESEATLQLVQQLEKYERVYIYMPTWRDSQRNLFATGMDLSALNESMNRQNAVLLLKPHPNTTLPPMDPMSNLIFVDSTADIYCIMPFTDVLITDYSSVMFDYPLVQGKGMILYQYDYEEYIKEREFNFPLEGNIIGRKTTTFDELIHAIDTLDFALDEDERIRFVEKFWGKTMVQDSSREILKQLKICEA